MKRRRAASHPNRTLEKHEYRVTRFPRAAKDDDNIDRPVNDRVQRERSYDPDRLRRKCERRDPQCNDEDAAENN